jgi:hypothetical protein
MKPSSRDPQLGLASPLNYAAIQSDKTKIPLEGEEAGRGSMQAQRLLRGQGREFFLDILFHRMSEIGMFGQR